MAQSTSLLDIANRICFCGPEILLPAIFGALFAVFALSLDYYVFSKTPYNLSWNSLISFSDKVPKSALLAICSIGIYTCYLTYGVIQEWIYSYKTASGETFSNTIFILLIQCFINSIVAAIGLWIFRSPHANVEAVSFQKSHIMLAISYIGAMGCSNESLKYIDYPTQALGKSCKILPVVLFGILFNTRKHTIHEILTCILITGGVILFQSKINSLTFNSASMIGYVLIFSSLILDGLTASIQDKLAANSTSSTHSLMFYTNSISFVILLVFSIATNQFLSGYYFCVNNDFNFSLLLLQFGVTSAIGQNFIFMTIQHFNALTLAIITTTRKFFTILLSVAIFNHSLGVNQWIGVGFVFLGLSLELFKGKKRIEVLGTDNKVK